MSLKNLNCIKNYCNDINDIKKTPTRPDDA